MEISREEALKLPASEYSHAAHGMLYAKWPGKFIGKYDYKYAVMVRSLALLNLHNIIYCGDCPFSVTGSF